VPLLWLQLVWGICTGAVVAAVLARIMIGWPTALLPAAERGAGT
jgi:hypothetical protein